MGFRTALNIPIFKSYEPLVQRDFTNDWAAF